MRILAGDVGGTKTALTLYERAPDGYRTIAEAVFKSPEHASFAEVIREFMKPALGPVDTAAFGVAGPVQDGVCSTTNLPWTMSASELSQVVNAPVGLVNDFHAVALGVHDLGPEDLRVLQPGRPDPNGAVAVIGAGTGLGEALCVPTPLGPRVVAGEGGHASFAPRNELELRLLAFLLRRYEHVSVERVVSGIALPDLYDFVVSEGLAPANPETQRRFKHESIGAVLSARASEDAAADRVLSLFVSAYGAEAGNWALKTLPRGGLVVAGGIAPRMIERLMRGGFIESFLAKGRLSGVLTTIPVAVVLHPNVGLLGARAHAATLARTTGASAAS